MKDFMVRNSSSEETPKVGIANFINGNRRRGASNTIRDRSPNRSPEYQLS